MPSHAPSRSHAIAPPSVHWPSGSIPAGTFAQLPALPGSAQERQVPAQAVMQQTPCAQMLDWHWSFDEQLPPGGSFPQLPLTQALPVTQSALVLQVVRHCPFAPHT